jgi:peptide methionine sulfoxide reductase msrA/msrB
MNKLSRLFWVLPIFLMLVNCHAQEPRKPAAGGSVNVRELNSDGQLTELRASPKVVRTEAQWKVLLSPEEYKVIRAQGTERPFCGLTHKSKEPGTYLCRACGLPLFSSQHKFESGTGWPSFWQPVAPENLLRETDNSLGMSRTEILCSRCHAHLGHVFEDGPPPTGERHCLNSIAMTFLPDLPALPEGQERAVFAGGCFWGVQQILDEIPGILSSRAGYTGGFLANPTYRDICSHLTGHAEAVEIIFDPRKVSFRELVNVFFELHDPTQLDRQGPDVGDQYRSSVFVQNADQELVVREAIDSLTQAKVFKGPIVTRLEPANVFWPAEEYHQKYGQKNRIQCHVRRTPH